MDLLKKLPQTVIIDGMEVGINTDFRTSIEFEGLFKENLSDEEFRNKALRLYYTTIPSNIDEAIQQMLLFYRCGKEFKQNKEPQNSKEDIYSFEYDADYIYSAFLDQYKIDIQDIDYLHWWKFKALFVGLKEDNEISRIIGIRATDISKLSKEQQEHYKKLKKIYEIPHDKKEVERSNSIAEILKRGGDLSELQE